MAEAKPRTSRTKKNIAKLQSIIRRNSFDPLLIRHIDWFLLLLILAISLFGVICVFAATGTTIEQEVTSMWQMFLLQPTYYARLQFLWIIIGLFIISATLYFSYTWLHKLSNGIYWANILLLVFVLAMERGRGNMAGWFKLGERTVQPSEFAKLAIIVSLAKWFSNRNRPIQTLRDLFPVAAYVGLPLLLICLQPDLGTAMVYMAIFAVMLFTSGTNWKLIVAIIATLAAIMIPVFYYLMNAEEVSFRVTRILVFLDPSLDPDSARQVTNAKIAIGSAGLWGKGMFTQGNFAILNYIPDDHTDFVFAIVGETFGFVGAGLLVLAYFVLMIRLCVLSSQAGDSFGAYLTIGIMAMMLFHIFENICMVVGLMPVTGIPLPFVSYGGSSMLTNFLGIGVVLNVHMRRFDVQRQTAASKPSIQI